MSYSEYEIQVKQTIVASIFTVDYSEYSSRWRGGGGNSQGRFIPARKRGPP